MTIDKDNLPAICEETEDNVENQPTEKKNSFDVYCDANPSAPECLMYDD